MQPQTVCQGRQVRGEELVWLRQWIAEHPQWSRTRLARELCQQWDWRNERGQIKDLAARSFLEKLARRGWLVLPALQSQRSHPRPKPDQPVLLDGPSDPISEPLQELQPLQWLRPRAGAPELKRWEAYLQRYHYLGWRAVGQNMKYLVRDQQGRDLACLLFGAAAWQAAARDQFIGWNHTQRTAGLHYLSNNTRSLILPWVRVAGLASYLLSQVAGRLRQEWQEQYGHPIGHPIYLLESFVEPGQFEGTCYQAAQWRSVGQTRGRGRQGANRMEPTEPPKEVYLYPLTRHFRPYLLGAA